MNCYGNRRCLRPGTLPQIQSTQLGFPKGGVSKASKHYFLKTGNKNVRRIFNQNNADMELIITSSWCLNNSDIMEFHEGLGANKRDTAADAPTVQQLQAALFPPMAAPIATGFAQGEMPGNAFFNNFLLKAQQVFLEEEENARMAKIREAKELFPFKDQLCPTHQTARWPAECQVLDERVKHISFNPPIPEEYYLQHGLEAHPKPLGEEFGTVVYQYNPTSAINYFNRSCSGGSKLFFTSTVDNEVEGLHFESRFECGNLAKAIRLTGTFYELYVRNDLYTSRHTQWFYFKISNIKKSTMYRFSIVNLSKGESLYTCGMRPLMYSTKESKLHSVGWKRCGENIAYFSNDNGNAEEEQPGTYTLTFTIEFAHDNDEVYFAHSYPYSYTDLQEYLQTLTNHPIKSTYSSLRLLCRSLAGNNIYYVTITSPSQGDIKKKAIVLTARVHPGEAPSSWMMKGLLDFLTSDTGPARELREKFIFKLVPMLNPDGVIVGNSRCSLTGRDLNRQYRTVIRETYPSIWYTKLMVRRLLDECGVAMFCDFHAHSRQNNSFIYGCENRKGYDKYLNEQVFPLMLHKNSADKFSFEDCRFRIQRNKEGTSRVVMWMMGICNSYTLEASFAGSDLGSRVNTHFSVADYEQIGRAFCQTLLDYYDETPLKERLRCKILKRLVKEGSTADEPTNITISDYSSDGGNSSSDEGAGNCDPQPFAAPPPSPSPAEKPVKKVPPPTAPPKLNIAKSPVVQRKTLPMYQATLSFALPDSNSSIDSDSADDIPAIMPKNGKCRRFLRKKKLKKYSKNQQRDHSDTELLKKKKPNKSVSVVDLSPKEKNKLSWNKPGISTVNATRALEQRNAQNTAKQLSEVQAKLLLLRRRIWSGTDDTDILPLSWGFSNFLANTSDENSPRKDNSSKKEKDRDKEQERDVNKELGSKSKEKIKIKEKQDKPKEKVKDKKEKSKDKCQHKEKRKDNCNEKPKNKGKDKVGNKPKQKKDRLKNKEKAKDNEKEKNKEKKGKDKKDKKGKDKDKKKNQEKDKITDKDKPKEKNKEKCKEKDKTKDKDKDIKIKKPKAIEPEKIDTNPKKSLIPPDEGSKQTTTQVVPLNKQKNNGVIKQKVIKTVEKSRPPTAQSKILPIMSTEVDVKKPRKTKISASAGCFQSKTQKKETKKKKKKRKPTAVLEKKIRTLTNIHSLNRKKK